MSPAGDDRVATQAFAAAFVDELAAGGVRDACLAPGSRSAPLAMALARDPRIRLLVHIDERSAAFLALGLARGRGDPVVVLGTSGTAAAEFHPAVLEAFHGGVPLVVCTADRPPELHDVGAPQTIDQHQLFGPATRWHADPGPPTALPGAERSWRRLAARALAIAAGPPAGPVHLNLAFREPLTPAPPPDVPHGDRPTAPGRPVIAVRPGRRAPDRRLVADLAGRLGAARRPLLVAGGLAQPPGRLTRAARRLAAACDIVVGAEPTSGLRRRGQLGLVTTYDAVLRDRSVAAELRPDLVVRVGAPPTSRVLREWLAAADCPTILLDPDDGWHDPELAVTELVRAEPAAVVAAVAGALPAGTSGRAVDWRLRWAAVESAARAAADAQLAHEPLFEPHVVRALVGALPGRATVVVGQSLAIRAVDGFLPAVRPAQRFLANRGASGIDGVVSTACGVAAGGSQGPTVLLIGDLSLFHDLNGLWAIRRHGLRLFVVCLDNDGGGIFSLLPPHDHPDVFESCFGTPLGLDWQRAAALHGLGYSAVETAADLGPALRRGLRAEGAGLLAVRVDREASRRAHLAVWAEMGAAARGVLRR